MTDLEKILQLIKAQFPNIEASIDSAETDTGSDWLDLKLDDMWACVEYNKKRLSKSCFVFGVTVNGEEIPFLGPDEIYDSAEKAAARVITVFKEKGTTMKEEQ